MLRHAPEPTTSTAVTSGRPSGLHPTASHTATMVAPSDAGARAAQIRDGWMGGCSYSCSCTPAPAPATTPTSGPVHAEDCLCNDCVRVDTRASKRAKQRCADEEGRALRSDVRAGAMGWARILAQMVPLGGSTASATAIVHFCSVGRRLGLFEHSKATQGRTGLYLYRPHSQTTQGRPTVTVRPRPSAQPQPSAVGQVVARSIPLFWRAD